jgi:hypothetical protein
MAEWHDPARHAEFAAEAKKAEHQRKINRAIHIAGTVANIGLSGLGAYALGKSVFKKAAPSSQKFIPHSHLSVGPHEHLTVPPHEHKWANIPKAVKSGIPVKRMKRKR